RRGQQLWPRARPVRLHSRRAQCPPSRAARRSLRARHARRERVAKGSHTTRLSSIGGGHGAPAIAPCSSDAASERGRLKPRLKGLAGAPPQNPPPRVREAHLGPV